MKPKQLLLLIFLLVSAAVSGQLSDARKYSLDSIVSSLDLSTRKDLEAAHRYLDSHGQTDEEKVWLFYGYLGTCFKYDKKRMGEVKAPFYNPELTAKKSKGVCRDFARVFEYLCSKSNIPCFVIRGKTSMSVFEYIARKFQRVSTKTNHQWNIVRVSGTWMLMDPTWTSIAAKNSVPVSDPVSKTSKKLTVSSVDRTYYNPSPEFMAETHAPIHPAFSLYSTVPTYKSIRKSPKRQLTYRENYQYNQVLDSIWNQKNTLFSRAFIDESFHYSHVPTLISLFHYELDIALVKPASNQAVTPDFYMERIARIRKLTQHIQDVFGVDYTERSQQTIDTLEKRKKLLEKELNTKKKR